MKNIYQATWAAIVACRAEPGKNAKREILAKLAKHAEAKNFFRLCYEPRVNFYQSKINPKFTSEKLDYVPEFDDTFIYSLVEKLCLRKLTGKAAKTWLTAAYNSFANQWERDMLTMIIERDVKAGFSESTVNTIWPGTVTDVPYMRCCLPKDTKLDKFPWKAGVYSQIKADGMFANISHDINGFVHIASRNGSPFPLDAFTDIVNEVKAKVPRGYQLHGEFTMGRNRLDGIEVLSRQEGNGMFNSLLKNGELEAGYVPIYDTWDMIPLEAAVPKGKHLVQYEDRFFDIKTLFGDGTGPIKCIETVIVHSLKEAFDHYRNALARGLEGTVIKHPEMIWQDTTSKHQVKMKLTFEVELKIVGFNPGNGKNEHLFGSIQCESACGQLKASVHGFTDKLRQEIDDEKDRLIGTVLTAKANSIMPPTNKDYYSLFLPIFVELRLDKKKANTLEEIQDAYDAAIASVSQ